MDIEYIIRPRISIAIVTMRDGKQVAGVYPHDERTNPALAKAMALERAVEAHTTQVLQADIANGY